VGGGGGSVAFSSRRSGEKKNHPSSLNTQEGLRGSGRGEVGSGKGVKLRGMGGARKGGV